MTLEPLDPGRTALLVVDMQNAFCYTEGTLGGTGADVAQRRAAIEAIRGLAERSRTTGMPVVWTMQEHFQIDESRARKRLASPTARDDRVAAPRGTWDAEIVEELADLAGAEPTMMIRKHRSGGFYETRLDLLLRMLGIDALLVAGVTAEASVETTIREASLRDYDVVVVTDCIVAARPEWESAAQAVWRDDLAVHATSDEVITWLDAAAMPGVRRLGHLLLETTDLQRAEKFYLGLLGLTVRKREQFRDGRPLTVTHEGLGLTNGRTGERGPIEHIAFQARGVRALSERARAAGATVLRGPEKSAYGVSVYLADPDGNQIELFGEDE